MHSRAWFWRMSLLTVSLTAVVGLALAYAATLNGLSSLQSALVNVRPTLVVARLAAIVTLIALWPILIRWAAQRGYCATTTAQALQAVRWRCAFWLLSLEFLIGVNGLEVVAKLLRAMLP